MAPSGKKRVERLAEVLKESRALRELCWRHLWMKAMMAAALEGSLNRNKAVSTKMVCVCEGEGAQIGRNMVPSFMTEQLAEVGVNEWRVQNRVVKELMKEEIWFEPMAVVLGKGIVKSAAWGLVARVIVGAVLSMTELVTDLFVLWQYWKGVQKILKFRNASLASLTTSLVLQLILVVGQNRKKGVRRTLKEMAYVITGMKPAVDAYGVASGAEKEKDTELDPMLEMTFSKGIEMFSESIPGIIIQTSAIISYLNSGVTVLMTPYLSQAVSVLTTGYVVYFIGGDMMFYLVMKAVRGDFRY
ncbi:hypothetical protein TrLO_g14653 [Triparma laevis f. longispina]|uniref:Uncharacterized protein n=1 Tax=Triparma laevis f. longispina TaxID=1714387 RepID=A0A9W7FV39_9STRA|nr:hypothetical protein TrLO_g14653 [Triparma laevis f. longispina]